MATTTETASYPDHHLSTVFLSLPAPDPFVHSSFHEAYTLPGFLIRSIEYHYIIQPTDCKCEQWWAGIACDVGLQEFWSPWFAQDSGEIVAYEAYILVIFGLAIFFQQFIMYIMYVRIKQLLQELDTIEGKIKINDNELENLLQRVEEFKNINYGDEWQKSS